MLPAGTALAQIASAPRRRAGFIYIPHGADMASWTPAAAGTGFELSPTLKTLEPFRDSLVVVSNLRRAGGQSAMHAAAACGWLSGATPKRTEAEDYESGTTIDQVVARRLGEGSPFPSLEFATEDFTGYVGGCTPNYSCAYLNSISWSSPTTPLPMEINPRAAFERLFGDGGTEAARRRILEDDGSILDSILTEARTLQSQLGTHDRAKVDNYLDHVREIERRIQRAEAAGRVDVTLDKPLGIPDSFEAHTALMTDLLVVAFQADLSRVFTFMVPQSATMFQFRGAALEFVSDEKGDVTHLIAHVVEGDFKGPRIR